LNNPRFVPTANRVLKYRVSLIVGRSSVSYAFLRMLVI